MNYRPTALAIAALIAAPSPCVGQDGSAAKSALRYSVIQARQLPDLNIPRFGHATLLTGGEVLVVGGHTSGFVPTQTAELWDGHEWRILPTTYTHDQALAIVLSSGKVLIAGGHQQPLGIGQTFTVELYDPTNHTFEGYGCLDRKRVFADAAELDSGHVVISGNWYERDDIELFDGTRQCRHIAASSQQRTSPHVLPISAHNAVIFSRLDTCAHELDSIVVDRIHGKPFVPPLFRSWRPRHLHVQRRSAYSRIAGGASEPYEHLITVEDSAGHLAIARITALPAIAPAADSAAFTLLPICQPIPQTYEGDSINYFAELIANRAAQRAYLVGVDARNRFYALAVSYAPALKGAKAPMTLYVSQPMPDAGISQPALTCDGDIIIAGGCNAEGNFVPYASVLLLPLGEAALHSSCLTSHPSLFILAGIFILLLAVVLGVGRARSALKTKRTPTGSRVASTLGDKDTPVNADGAIKEEAVTLSEGQRITEYIRSSELFRHSDLKVSDVAAQLNLTPRAVSESIKVETGQTFTQFINILRVDYAKALLRQSPAMKIGAVGMDAGFANETSFYRTFKAITGTTPKEWMAQQQIFTNDL